MAELKHCPFCGGKAELDYARKNFNYTDTDGRAMSIGYFYTCQCQNEICGCKIGIYEDARMAVEAWNRRADNG